MKKWENMTLIGEQILFRPTYHKKYVRYIYFLLFSWIQLKNIYTLEKLEKNLK